MGVDREGQRSGAQPTAPPAALTSRLGYLLKHAQLRLAESSAKALARFDITGRELAVLAVLAAEYPVSQLEAAGLLGVDRTTMVALVDELEAKGLAVRRRSPDDRRKNIVELTPAGRDCLDQAEESRQEVERRFLAPLDAAEVDQFLHILQRLVTTSPEQ